MWRLLLAAILWACFASDSLAEEHITHLSSHIAVRPNGSIVVRDTIEVMVLGEQIKHGVFYGFSAHYTRLRPPGANLPAHVEGVLLDGKPETHVMEATDTGPRLKIGGADVLLPTGPHTYVISYCLEQQFSVLPGADILDRYVTSRWTFPIDKFDVTVDLPSGSKINGLHVAAGDPDSASITRETDSIHAETTRGLAPQEAVELLLSLEKGSIQQTPGGCEKTS